MVQESPGDNRSGSAEGQGRPLGAGAIAALTGGGLLAIFMIQNTEDVKIDFLFWDFTWPLWLYTFVIALVGALLWVRPSSRATASIEWLSARHNNEEPGRCYPV
jgi:hypothetical protein